MTDTVTRRFNIGDPVTINGGTDGGAHWLPARPGVVVGLDAGPFCTTCHCCPPNPEHQFDGSLCCPGPFYSVESDCLDGDHKHRERYAEHELSYPCGCGSPAVLAWYDEALCLRCYYEGGNAMGLVTKTETDGGPVYSPSNP